MSGAELLVRLWSLGVELHADGERLRWRTPADVITPKVLDALKVAKPALMELLEAQALAEHDLRRCAGCGRIQSLRWFDEGGGLCDECRESGER